MSSLRKVIEHLDLQADMATVIFTDEISTDENRDYRRGFRAGVLYAYLELKSEVRTIANAAAE